MLPCKSVELSDNRNEWMDGTLNHYHDDSALTDPLISGIAKGSEAYKLVGSYVSTPLNWCEIFQRRVAGYSTDCIHCRAVITGKNSAYQSISDLKGTTIGISRQGR